MDPIYSQKRIYFITMMVHTVSYFFIGALAFFIADYSHIFTQPSLREYLRPADHFLVMSGALFHPGLSYASYSAPSRKEMAVSPPAGMFYFNSAHGFGGIA